MHPLQVIIYILLLASLLIAPLGLADEARRIVTADASKLGVGQNIGFVEKLVHESAAAKQILQSDNAEARALREKAITHLEEARTAEAQGNAEAVNEALNKAKKAIFTGIRLVGKKTVNDKKQENYNKKRKSLESLLVAHKRIRKENEQGQDANTQATRASLKTETYTEAKMQEAQAHYDIGEFVEAGEVLNIAYLSLKLSLTKLRDGKKLVRSLHFETKEDEYKYELRRNDTHNMLINTVLKEKREDPRLGKLMDIPLKEAEKQRATAEQQAGSGDFESAIKTMEESTKHIIRAIRMAGIFIPG